MALGFVGLYVVLAKKTFESDKVSYVFETQQTQTSSLARSFESQIDRITFDVRSILTGFDPVGRKLNIGAQKVFWDHPQILALRLRNPSTAEYLLQIEKNQGLIESMGTEWPTMTEKTDLRPTEKNRFLMTIGKDAQVLFEIDNNLSKPLKGQVMALLHDGKIINRSTGTGLSDQAISTALKTLPSSEATSIIDIQENPYLVSIGRANEGQMLFATLTEKTAALGALDLLFKRSLVFLAFSFFATVIVSLLLSNQLTQNLNSLAQTAERIGSGEFSATPAVKSRDEMGILAKAFSKMSEEIQRLLKETVDKTRMEEELKTARFVQESLFPRQSYYENAHARVAGLNKTTTECSGDWWFYYQQGSDLYVFVADATGHGIPAALITAAARSVFSFVRSSELSLKEILAHWDRATIECSNGRVFMTAFAMRLNVELGEISYINAGHEPPVLIKKLPDGKSKASYVIGEQSHSLGENKNVWLENKLQLDAGDRLLIYTDGLLAIRSPDGKSYSEKRFLSYLEKTIQPKMSPLELIEKVDEHFMTLNAGQPLPDDVTLVSVDFKAKS